VTFGSNATANVRLPAEGNNIQPNHAVLTMDEQTNEVGNLLGKKKVLSEIYGLVHKT
jgi:hypothetical protein